jgi:diaminopimelate epimerase
VIPFVKMHGIGNDFVMIDAIRNPIPEDRYAELSKSVCDRRYGIGADGLIVALRGDRAPYRMRMFNPDGTEAAMCGNGVRCLGAFLVAQGHEIGPTIGVDVADRTVQLELLPEGRVRADMGLAGLTRGEIGMTGESREKFLDEPVNVEGQLFQGTAVSIGNPHLVLFVENAAGIHLEHIGPILERSPLFPGRTNVHFAQMVDRSRLIQRTWERGAGITLACGSGACACAVAATETGRADRRVVVQLPGGELEIEYQPDGRVFMTGPTATAFAGEMSG